MKKHVFGTMALCATLMTGVAANAQTSVSDNRVLRDSSGDVVRALGSGTCVRTNWEAGDDVCAPRPMAEVKAPVKQTRTMLSTDEKTAYFEFDKAVLTPEAQNRLDEVARRLSTAKDVAT